MNKKIELDVIIDDDKWLECVDFDAIKVCQEIKDLTFSFVYDETKHEVIELANSINVSVCLSNDEEVHKLNREFRGMDKPTNVLSFANIDDDELWDGIESGEKDVELGEIILAFETLQREAFEKGIGVYQHFAHLLVHGFLHLLGFDHEDDKDADVMEGMEIDILREFSIENPYKDDEI
ncbi:MAG: rRNA maturation RNase YbeY [Alphaproteobacteria bacterium]|nr:rRNA maturation RNase YbeY [Alphaproteobacteria bacterium]